MTSPPSPLSLKGEGESESRHCLQRRVVFTLWITYATYYLCRANFSIAVPSLEKLPGMSTELVGWIMTAMLLAYGVGQVVHGLLVDRFGPRRVGTVGMVVSATCNVLFGLAAAGPAFVALWAVNGFAQATGAPSRIKALGNWVAARDRGRMMGVLGTDYVVGNAAAWLLSGLLVRHYDWRAVFIVPGVVMFVSALHFAWRLRDHPHDVGLPDPDDVNATGATRVAQRRDLSGIARRSFGSGRVWIVAVAYFGVDLFRYGFLNWSFAYLSEGGAEVGLAKDVLLVVMVPAFGALGILVSGYWTDRMQGRRVPVVVVMLLISAALAAALRFVPRGSGETVHLVTTFALLAGVGFFLYGPHLLMGATMAIDLGTPHASASASGVIDGVGYLGAAVAGVGTSWARARWGWDGAFVLWCGAAVFAALLMTVLWRVRPVPVERA